MWLIFVALDVTYLAVPSSLVKKSIDAGRTPEAAQYLADALERLMSLSLATTNDAQHWQAERERVQSTLKEKFPQFEFYHEVWHFLADADIRARDSGYLAYQHRLMSDYIAQLRDDHAAI